MGAQPRIAFNSGRTTIGPGPMLYAHSLPDGFPRSAWEALEKHLEDVAREAASRASWFGANEFAYIAGLLHDLGKAKPGFQAYLEGGSHEPHSSEGAAFAIERYPGLLGRMLAFCIAGHHAGLANGATEGGGTTPLCVRLDQAAKVDLLGGLEAPELSRRLPPQFVKDMSSFSLSFFIRMLFSCLVDADFLATEAFYARAEGREVERGWSGELSTLKARLDAHFSQRFADASGEVNDLRAEVLAACRAAAQGAPGLFSLTVPTGGGKTLSSLAFALDHALAHNLRRVVYVIPYTSIIEQTADVFCEALEERDAILEHHSAFDWDRPLDDERDDEGRDGLAKLRRAAENWDRPIVVTTAVQFFESLFAARTSRCRKLHNLAKSVIILDEAQSLPLRLLRPCLAAANELAQGYGASVVLCTATQPAVHREKGFRAPEGLTGVREIAPDPERLYERLKRVRVENLPALDDDALISRLSEEAQVLCIVNTRRHARELFERLPPEGCFHLSTLMTPDHRRAKLNEIRDCLKAGKPVRLVATSLIEAGVDIDFPVVYRALAGIDSVAQAAGRCNREGLLGRAGGRVYVFEPAPVDGRRPPRDIVQLADAARMVLRDHAADPLSLAAVHAYFEEVYWRRGDSELDTAQIVKMIHESRGPWDRPDFQFASVAEKFRVIESAMTPVIIPSFEGMPYGASKEAIGELVYAERPSGACRRALQRTSVQVPPRVRLSLIAARAAEVVRPTELGDQFVLLKNHDLYWKDRGFDWSDPAFRAAEALIF